MFLRGVQVRGERLPTQKGELLSSLDIESSLTAAHTQAADEDEPTVQPTPVHTTKAASCVRCTHADLIIHARVWTNDDNMSTRALDETTSCGIQR